MHRQFLHKFTVWFKFLGKLRYLFKINAPVWRYFAPSILNPYAATDPLYSYLNSPIRKILWYMILLWANWVNYYIFIWSTFSTIYQTQIILKSLTNTFQSAYPKESLNGINTFSEIRAVDWEILLLEDNHTPETLISMTKHVSQ